MSRLARRIQHAPPSGANGSNAVVQIAQNNGVVGDVLISGNSGNVWCNNGQPIPTRDRITDDTDQSSSRLCGATQDTYGYPYYSYQ